jgi:hypothetical protein
MVTRRRAAGCVRAFGHHSDRSVLREGAHDLVSDSGSASVAGAAAEPSGAWWNPRRAEAMAAVLSPPWSEEILQQFACIFNALRLSASSKRHRGPDSGSDWRPYPRARRPRERQGLEVEKLGYLPTDVPEDDGDGRAAQYGQRNHGGRSNAEPEPHRHGDLIGIDGRS